MSIKQNSQRIIVFARGLVPQTLREVLGAFPGAFKLRGRKWIREDPYLQEPSVWTAPGRSQFTIGIIEEFWHLHWPLVSACREVGMSYEILDISGTDWFQTLKKSKCDGFIARPSVQYKPWKEMYDERLRVFAASDDRPLSPDLDALWMWESKRRTHYWLEANEIEHPKTWVFYDFESAIEFSSNCDLPIVFKSDSGSGASGVLIFIKRHALRRHIRRCFKKGYSTYRRSKHDREYGSVVFQRYIPNLREWRTVRIGDSFFAYEKVMGSEFHSGSGEFKYGRPPDDVLDLAKKITDLSGFRSLNVDVFVDENGKLFVNELQAFWGQAGSREICRIDGQSGRMFFDDDSEQWIFEKGEFCQNYMCNLRVEMMIEMLENKHKRTDPNKLKT